MTMSKRVISLYCAIGLLAGVLATADACAQPYPSRPVQIISNSAPGAGSDLVSRSISDRLASLLGGVVYVENRIGVAGLIGAEFVKKAAPDGHTLMVCGDDLSLWRALGIRESVNVLTDFEHIVQLGATEFFLVVSGEALAASTAQDLVRMAKQKPGALSYGSPGIGSPHHLVTELFKQQTGTDIVHVPYKGIAPVMPDLIAGRVQMVITGYPVISSLMQSGKLKILASAGAARSRLQPDYPTLREQGIPNVEMAGYFMFLAPRGTPQAIVARLNTAANQVLSIQQVREDLLKRGFIPAGGTAEQLREKLRFEIDKWSKVVKTAGIKAEE
jgi:tripartite-type tricarboxylate transporter receptor subunit TctC